MLSSESLDQLKKAASDPLKRKLIAKDETLVGGLVLLLSKDDKRIVIDALEIILALAIPVDQREFLLDFLGMKHQLQCLSQDTNPLDHIRALATQALDRMSSTVPVPSQPRLRTQNAKISHPLQSMSKPSRKVNKPFITASKFKTITLQIQGLDDKGDMEVCKELLLTVRGVVSITFDISKHRSIIRVKPDITAYTLADAIHKSNSMVAEQVLRGENGEEQLTPLHDAHEKKENLSLPAYLPDEDSPMKVDDKAVRKYGVEQDEEDGQGWLGAAANFLAKSFYW